VICGLALPLAALAAMGLLNSGAVSAYPPANAPAPAAQEIIKPEDIELETTDHVQLNATYYASNLGKEAVPIVMLHGWKGSRADLASLALQMQARGCAVIVPDLRGHGDSTQVKVGDATRSIEQATMKKTDFAAMASATGDMEAINKFLMDKNNAGELNINKLCVVGYEMGAVVAVNWAAFDWSWPDLVTMKQGKDVKALVLISPTSNFHGLGINEAIAKKPNLFKTDDNDSLSVLIIVGDKNLKAMGEAKQINQILGSKRAKPYTEEKDIKEKQKLFFYPLPDTSLESGETLKDPAVSTDVEKVIAQFVELRLTSKKIPWTSRKQ